MIIIKKAKKSFKEKINSEGEKYIEVIEVGEERVENFNKQSDETRKIQLQNAIDEINERLAIYK